MLSSSLIGINDIVAVNLQCFGLIILGYISRKFDLIGPGEAKGLNIFVSYFALPALIFLSIARLSLDKIDFNFVGNIFISKCFIFVIVLLLTFLLSRKSLSKLGSLRRSAIFAIFATQSNDFALGYPILLSLYGKSQSSLANYIYILAPIQLMVLNPIGLFLIEISRNLEQNHSFASNLKRSMLIFKIICQKIFINPIIFSTFLGIVINLLNHNTFPQVIVPFLESLSHAFAAVALFLLGLNLYGNFSLLNKFSQPLLITLVLVSIKLFIMPILNRMLVQHVTIFSTSSNETLSEFAFLYGTFPAAPTVYIFSNFYNIETVIVSAGLVISTLLSSPFIFVSANMIRISSEIDYVTLNDDLIATIFYTSIISLFGTLMLLCSFFFGFKFHSITHRCSLKILISHFFVLFAGLMFRFNTGSFSLYDTLSVVQYFLFNLGLFSLKLWISLLSVTLVLLYAKSLCFAIKISTRLLYASLTILAIYIIFLTLTYGRQMPATDQMIDLYYGVNRVHLSVSIFMSCFAILSTFVAFILLHHYKSKIQYRRLNPNQSDESLESEVSGDTLSDSSPATSQLVEDRLTHTVVEVEDLYLTLPNNVTGEDFKDRCNQNCHTCCTVEKDCGDRLRQYHHTLESVMEAVEMTPSPLHDESLSNDFHQVYQHMYLLLFSILTIIIHLGVEVFHFIQDKPSGIYVEIKFLDLLFTFTQGFVMFVIFGFDMDAIIHKLTNLFKLSDECEIYLPPLGSLSSDTVTICDRFRSQYLNQCSGEITFRSAGESSQSETVSGCARDCQVYFHGKQLVDWLLAKRLVSSREDAVYLCQHLLYGRVIEHITKHHYFCDNTFFYRFCC